MLKYKFKLEPFSFVKWTFWYPTRYDISNHNDPLTFLCFLPKQKLPLPSKQTQTSSKQQRPAKKKIQPPENKNRQQKNNIQKNTLEKNKKKNPQPMPRKI